MNDQKPNFSASAESQALVKLLGAAEIGSVVTYDEMLASTGEQALSKIRGNIQTARRTLLNQKSIVFGTVDGVGLKRLDASGVVGDGKCRLRRIRRASARAARTIACADFKALTEPEKRDALSIQAQIGAIQLATSISAQHQIEQKLTQGKQLEVGKVVDFFRAVA